MSTNNEDTSCNTKKLDKPKKQQDRNHKCFKCGGTGHHAKICPVSAMKEIKEEKEKCKYNHGNNDKGNIFKYNNNSKHKNYPKT